MVLSIPPFRADHVGSLLRPAALKEARARRERGEISADGLRAAEDAAIERIIGRQAEIGLRSATDGEFRRAMWHFDFLEHLDGVESFRADHGIAFKGGIETQAKGLRVTGKLGFSTHPMIEHFRFLREHTGAMAKMTIPSPSVLHFRGGRRAISPDVYPDMEDFYRDLGLAYRAAVQAFGGSGGRIVNVAARPALEETTRDLVADFYTRDARADRDHLARAVGQRHDVVAHRHAIGAAHDAEVAEIERAGRHLDQHLAVLRFRLRQIDASDRFYTGAAFGQLIGTHA